MSSGKHREPPKDEFQRFVDAMELRTCHACGKDDTEINGLHWRCRKCGAYGEDGAGLSNAQREMLTELKHERLVREAPTSLPAPFGGRQFAVSYQRHAPVLTEIT